MDHLARNGWGILDDQRRLPEIGTSVALGTGSPFPNHVGQMNTTHLFSIQTVHGQSFACTLEFLQLASSSRREALERELASPSTAREVNPETNALAPLETSRPFDA